MGCFPLAEEIRESRDTQTQPHVAIGAAMVWIHRTAAHDLPRGAGPVPLHAIPLVAVGLRGTPVPCDPGTPVSAPALHGPEEGEDT